MANEHASAEALGFTKAIVLEIVRTVDGGGCFQIVVVGKLRSGKSLISARLGELLAPLFGRKFDASYIKHEPDEFLELLADSSKMARGSVAVLDEAGIAASNRTWYSKTNFAITQVVQSFGHKGYIVIYNLPHLKFLDPAIVRLFNVLIKTVGYPKRSQRRMWGKFYWWRVEPETGKVMRNLARWKDENGKHVVRCIEFEFPAEELIQEYVKNATVYKDKVIEVAQRIVDTEKKVEKSDRIDVKAVVEQVMLLPERYVRANGKVDTGLVEIDFGIGGRKSQQVKSLVESRLTHSGSNNLVINGGKS